MKIDNIFIEKLRTDFSMLENQVDLCVVLNKINSLLYNDSIAEIKIAEIYFFASNSTSSYNTFNISKKTGGIRKIYAPKKRLKEILKPLSILLQCVYVPSQHCHGFTWNKSIVSNAKCHLGKNYVYNLDLTNFFPSIHQTRINKRLQLEPFNFNLELAKTISSLCCFYHYGRFKNILPQGAPTSPIISNIICESLDKSLANLSKKYNVSYSRYADDITFSSLHNVFQNKSRFIGEVKSIIKNQNFNINPKKTRLQKKGYRQVVTGLIVNEKVNVSKRFIKKIRIMLHMVQSFGLEDAQMYFIANSLKEKGKFKNNLKPKIEDVIKGKLDYLKMVKGKDDSTYVGLKNKFDSLNLKI